MTEHSPARAAVGMGVVTAVSRSFGFLRVLVIAAVLGATYLGNTFQASNSVSNVLFELLAAGALSAVLVPTFVELLDAGRADEAERLANGLLGIALLVLGAVVVLGYATAPLVARALSSGAPNSSVAAHQRALSTFLLWFFVPQVLLYAFGAVATALLYARRRFAITAAAPIGNTVVMVGALLVFRTVAGASPGLHLSLGEKLLLALAGTGGVVAFVGLLVLAARSSGFRLRPRIARGDPAVNRLLRMSGWGVLLHAIAGALLGAALVLGNGVEGGVVAYQTAFVFFLAPYATLAQPVHTAILPELANEAGRGDLDAFARSVRWALDSIAGFVVPVSAAMVALAYPVMRVVAFGAIHGSAVSLLAAGLASLALGLYGYGAFLLLARSYYALGDSRTPAMVAIAAAVIGVGTMFATAPFAHGSARVAVLGIGHSVAYAFGAVVLGIGLSRRIGVAIVPTGLLRTTGISAVVATGAWLVTRWIVPTGRATQLAELSLVTVAGGALYVGAMRVLGNPLRISGRREEIPLP
ncbi:MAG: putative rane protein putative virulence factor [Actinomycetia bacterium]|nr:putative rane protein putative virulence factor [Actinomycetes bacterium]